MSPRFLQVSFKLCRRLKLTDGILVVLVGAKVAWHLLYERYQEKCNQMLRFLLPKISICFGSSWVPKEKHKKQHIDYVLNTHVCLVKIRMLSAGYSYHFKNIAVCV